MLIQDVKLGCLLAGLVCVGRAVLAKLFLIELFGTSIWGFWNSVMDAFEVGLGVLMLTKSLMRVIRLFEALVRLLSCLHVELFFCVFELCFCMSMLCMIFLELLAWLSSLFWHSEMLWCLPWWVKTRLMYWMIDYAFVVKWCYLCEVGRHVGCYALLLLYLVKSELYLLSKWNSGKGVFLCLCEAVAEMRFMCYVTLRFLACCWV